eukprot:scaffold97522_cov69-Phaeocystis_antarctica.AAC.3
MKADTHVMPVDKKVIVMIPLLLTTYYLLLTSYRHVCGQEGDRQDPARLCLRQEGDAGWTDPARRAAGILHGNGTVRKHQGRQAAPRLHHGRLMKPTVTVTVTAQYTRLISAGER